MLKSELFGHASGAFTGAQRARRGLMIEAHGGTLLLDEIGELPADMQAKLLRALQDGRGRPVGANFERTVDVRIVAATNRDLEQDVARKVFREDLFYRLNTFKCRFRRCLSGQGFWRCSRAIRFRATCASSPTSANGR